MSDSKGKLIIISGPSGVGKGAIINELFKDKSLNLAYSVSYTTRQPRNYEIPEINYFFVTKEEFLKRVKENDFLEYTNFIDNYYGTSKSYVEQLQKDGYNVILEIEADGASQVIKNYPDKAHCFSIFIMPPSFEVLEQRIRLRASESKEIIEARLNKAKEEFELQSQYDYVVVNDILQDAVTEIQEIIRKNINK
ncbi:guanylate kinase [Spiroplasma platyhelix]|uniref:Guanylate kinase n=1 Tax=Spiroplasma platyhelix PALS-1 TaxID=1276218 RepID=A0A846TPN1_9MOLU|nr:guanylate kinase [Spiroplasma platyhelix]MBE4703857.1 Guanylate kinase [Spiroplasma platyhelix PALS-1]NKE38230.1 guanylate kinase [Spiroplasma platyhelix PALS-1]UJB29115.1 guanylate kinase [Spiroplasma platyhelix PALS-1]